MVVPYRKVANLEDLTLVESSELMEFSRTAIRVLKTVSHPDAINWGCNLGRASGGSVGDHLHLHIVPRWSGDANFMTVIDGTKVLPQVLRETRRLLAEGWIALDDARRRCCGTGGESPVEAWHESQCGNCRWGSSDHRYRGDPDPNRACGVGGCVVWLVCRI